MTRGWTHCRICGKPVLNIYRKIHEQKFCLKMRKDRGDADMMFRELPKSTWKPELKDPKQKRLFEVAPPERSKKK